MNRFYHFFHMLFRYFFKIVFGVKTYGLENIPHENKAFVFASNHQSYLDPPVIGSMVNQQLAFAAKKELFSMPVISSFVKRANCIPIDRKNFSLSSMRLMLKAIKEEKLSLMIFPEGTRKKNLSEAKRGLGFIVQKTNAPVIPVYIKNSDHFLLAFFRIKPIIVYYGKPIEFDLTRFDKKTASVEISNLVLDEIKKIRENIES